MSDATAQRAILRVIDEMHARLGQDLTLEGMARTAMFSKFHFARVFRDATGTSPRRFLSALRIQEAKCLLLSTELSVADISSAVGYSSVGTFSSRFKACVGVSPTTFRDQRGQAAGLGPAGSRTAAPADAVAVRGRVVLPGDRPLGPVFVGVFPTPIPQGRPVRYTVMDSPGPFELEGVPAGDWYLLAHSVPYGSPSAPAGQGHGSPESLSVGRHGPVTVRAGVLAMPVDIVLRPSDPLDPPVLIALPSDGSTPSAAA